MCALEGIEEWLELLGVQIVLWPDILCIEAYCIKKPTFYIDNRMNNEIIDCG
jgi:hypothetical protein